MSDRYEDLLYESGLTAQGCWDSLDEYDKQAIIQFGDLIVRECINQTNNFVSIPMVKHAIAKRFGIENE
jgi:hypothetical protein